MTARMDTLIGESYSIQKFADLPQHYQMAIAWYNVMECEGWEDISTPEWETDAEAKAGLAALLPKYVEKYGEDLFGTITLSANALTASVMRDEDIADSYQSWDDYHTDYVRGGDVQAHPKANRWPVLLSYDNYETLWDGWHRFHSYIRDGDVEIPAIFHPMDHHLAPEPAQQAR